MGLQSRGQAVLSAILSLVIIILILYMAFSGRMSHEMRFVRLTLEEEAAHFLAEGCIEEGIAQVRESADVATSPLFGFFREPVVQPVRMEPTHARKLAEECYHGVKAELELSLERLDSAQLPGDLVEDSLDRVGHVSFVASVRLGRGKARVRVVKQFRLQDVSTPAPFKKYGLVMGAMGFAPKSADQVTVWRLSPEEVNVLNNRWRYPMSVRGSGREMKGYPFVRQRLSYFFPTWQDMKEYLEEGASLQFQGDVLSPDPLTLQIRSSRLAGAGRVLSPDATIVLNRVEVGSGSALGFGVLSGGALVIEGFAKGKPAPISVFLPSGRLCFRGESGVFGFVLARDLEDRKEAARISQDPALAKPRTVVVLSGQSLIWQANP